MMKKIITETVRALRNNQTKCEKILWMYLRGKQLGNKFTRQKPIQFNIQGNKTFIIADFFCREARLIIELDGPIHERRKFHDNSRDSIAGIYGYKTLRFSNDEVLNDIQDVLNKITYAINQT